MKQVINYLQHAREVISLTYTRDLYYAPCRVTAT
jgi:hypothetical protein